MFTRISGGLMVVNFVISAFSFSLEFYHLIEAKVLEKNDLLDISELRYLLSKISFAPHFIVE
jgi:hypothetical protein